MKIAVMTSLSAIGDMKVNTSQWCMRFVAKLKFNYLAIVLSLYSFFISQSNTMAQVLKLGMVKDESGNSKLLGRYSVDSAMLIPVGKEMGLLRDKGYLLASLDSIYSKNDTLTAQIFVGKKYRYAYIDWDRFPKSFLVQANVRANHKKLLTPKIFAQSISKILDHAQRTGYPFASIAIDSLAVQGETVHVRPAYAPGPYISYDTLHMKGIKKTNSAFMAKYLHLVKDDPYDQQQIDRVRSRIRELSFISLSDAPRVEFVNNKALVSMDLTEEKVNSFDGIIGFLQNPSSESLTITGMVDLELHNLFGKGRELGLSWQRQQALSQTLNMNYAHPMILGSDIEMSFGYGQLKQDTSFINRNMHVEFEVPIKAIGFTTTYTRNAGRLLGTPREGELFAQLADFNIDYYGVGATYAGFEPRDLYEAGWIANIEMAIGDKKVVRDPSIGIIGQPSSKPVSVQYRIGGSITRQQKVWGNVIANVRVTAFSLFNKQLYLNDLFRLGGLNSLRGFNEFEIYANQYMLSNFELRWVWSSSSYFFGFYDQAFYKMGVGNSVNRDKPYGLGAGLSLATEAGFFTLVYALGKSKSQMLNFNQAKIHFGFTSKF